MAERGIEPQDVDQLIEKGVVWSIEVDQYKSGFDVRPPKWILRWPSREGCVLEGVFAVDGIRLIGITVYWNEGAGVPLDLPQAA